MGELDRYLSRGGQAAFVLLGGDVLIRLAEVVAIVDHEACATAPTREFLGLCRRRGELHDLSGAAGFKTAVICRRRVFLSPLSSATLRRRIGAGRPA